MCSPASREHTICFFLFSSRLKNSFIRQERIQWQDHTLRAYVCLLTEVCCTTSLQGGWFQWEKDTIKECINTHQYRQYVCIQHTEHTQINAVLEILNTHIEQTWVSADQFLRNIGAFHHWPQDWLLDFSLYSPILSFLHLSPLLLLCALNHQSLRKHFL